MKPSFHSQNPKTEAENHADDSKSCNSDLCGHGAIQHSGYVFQAQFQIWEQHEYLQTVVQSPGEGAGTAVCEIHGQLGGKLQVDFSGSFGRGGAVGQ